MCDEKCSFMNAKRFDLKLYCPLFYRIYSSQYIFNVIILKSNQSAEVYKCEFLLYSDQVQY